MKKTIEMTAKADRASVSRLAYELWENAGRPAGRDLEFWLAAEARMCAPAQPQQSVTPAPALAAPQVTAQSKTPKAARTSAGKKTWPKPYPSLPRF